MTEQTIDLFVSLNTALRQLKLYPPEHPVCASAIENALEKTEATLENKDRITFGLAGDTVICEGYPLVELGKLADSLCSALRSLSISWITFGHGLARHELAGWLLHLKDASRPAGKEGWEAWTGSSIRMGGRETGGKSLDPVRFPAEEIVAGFSGWLRTGGTTAVNDLRGLMGGVAKEVESEKLPLAVVEHALDSHQYLVQRGLCVSLISMALGKRVGIGGATLCDIGLAGLLCDVGLASVNDRSLASKHSGSIDPEVWSNHPAEGGRTLLRSLAPSIAVVAASEHHWGLKYSSSTRHPFSTVVGIADDIVGRILGGYGQPGHRLDTALIGLAREGDHYPHELIWHLFQMSGLFGEGSRVRLSNRKRATIRRMNPRDPVRPRVVLEMTRRRGRSVDLSEVAGGPTIAALVLD
jgi:hypothetical protein